MISNGTKTTAPNVKAEITRALKKKNVSILYAITRGRLRRFLLSSGWLDRRNLVEDEAVLDLFHRQPLGFEDTRPAGIPAILFVQTQTRSAPQLLGAHRRDVDEEEPALDGRRLRPLNRLVDFWLWLDLRCVVGGFHRGTVALGRPQAQGLRPQAEA